MNKNEIPPVIEIKDEEELKPEVKETPKEEIKPITTTPVTNEVKPVLNEVVIEPVVKEESSIGYIIVSLLVPFVGAIFFMEWINTYKKKIGVKTLVCSLINFLVLVILYAFVLPMFIDNRCAKYGADYLLGEDDIGEYCSVDGITKIYLDGNNDNTQPTNNPDEKIKYDDEDENIEYDDVYYVIIKEEIDNFKDLDFSNKTTDKDPDRASVTISNGKILYTDIANSKSEVEVPNISDAISVGLRGNCGSVTGIVYLNNKNELYEINLDHGALVLNDDKELEEKDVILLAKDAVKFTLIDTFDVGTCGGKELLYINKNGDTRFLNRIVAGKAKYVKPEKKEYLWLSKYTYDYVIYGINENSIVGKPLKDEKGKSMTCSALFINEEDGSSYVLNEQSYLYYFGKEELNNKTGKLLYEKKITKFKGENDKVKFTLEDGKEVELKVRREY